MSKTNKNSKSIRITLPAYSILNTSLIEELDLLFDLAPPHMLHRSIREIFWSYLCSTEQEDLHPQFKEIAADFKFLLRFLELAESYEREKESEPTERKESGSKKKD